METLKNELKLWQKKEWCIPKPGAEFVAQMEDSLLQFDLQAAI